MRARQFHFTVMVIAAMLLAATAYSQAPKKEKGESPKMLNGLPAGTYADFQTNQGEFVIHLFTEKAPLTTANFIGLAEGTKPFINPETNKEEKRPFYDGLIFHRVIDGFMLQGGDPTGTGMGGPGFRFKDEFNKDLRHNKPGILSMANSGPNTNGSQFFITVAPTPHLDDRHSVFGEVVRGMETINKIAKVPKGAQDRPLKDVVMEKVRIYRLGADGKPVEAKTAEPPKK